MRCHVCATLYAAAAILHFPGNRLGIPPSHAVHTGRLPQICARSRCEGRARRCARWWRWCAVGLLWSGRLFVVLVGRGIHIGGFWRKCRLALFVGVAGIYALLCVRLGVGGVRQADPRCVLRAKRTAPSHLRHNGHLVRLGRLRGRQCRRRRRRAHSLGRRAFGQWWAVAVLLLGGRRACLAGAGALMALAVTVTVAIAVPVPVLVLVLVLVLCARAAALAVGVLFATAVRVRRCLGHVEEAAWWSFSSV